MRTPYGKLIRDRIPEIMDAAGVRYEIAPLDHDAFISALLAKLQEEAAEIAGAAGRTERITEIADLYEALAALLSAEGIDAADVDGVRQQRREERGGFEQRLELRWTER
ncbi:MAG: nucleoside triphosphate pyrophosphohydrolase [Trueperaceae bacterium]|nr:nucleoside triphosphate pyrophosphohydrolase [Trueperaceae bacterium]